MRALLALTCLCLAAPPALAAAKKKPPPPKAAPPPPGPRPSADAAVAACPLDGLPDARLAWNALGHLWLIEGEDVLYVGEVGEPLPAETSLRCAGTHARLDVVRGGVTMSAASTTIDFSEIATANRRTPEDRARRIAERALAAGDVGAAWAALEPLAPADPQTAELRVWLAQDATAAGEIFLAQGALAGLPRDAPGLDDAWGRLAAASARAARDALEGGRSADAVPALAPAWAALERGLPESALSTPARRNIQQLTAEALLAAGQAAQAAAALEALVAAEPARGQAWLLLAEARWQEGDKRASRAAYAEAAALLNPDSWPPTLAERCPRCDR